MFFQASRVRQAGLPLAVAVRIGERWVHAFPWCRWPRDVPLSVHFFRTGRGASGNASGEGAEEARSSEALEAPGKGREADAFPDDAACSSDRADRRC